MDQNTIVGIYKLKSGQYQTSYVDPETSKRVRAKFRTRKEAKDQEKKIQKRLSGIEDGLDSTKKLLEFIPLYRDTFPSAKMFTRGPYLFESFTTTFGARIPNEIEKHEFANWLQKISDEKNYSARTLVLVKYCFTPFINFLVEQGVVEENRLSKVKLNRNGKRKMERVYLSEEELRIILQTFKEKSPREVYPVAYFQIHTGAKTGETLRLKWDQLDFEKETVYLPAADNCDERNLKMPAQLVTALKSITPCGDFVFTNENGEPWTSSSYRKRFDRYRAHTGILKYFNCMAFRNTFAFHFLNKGGNLQQLQVLLGHRSIDMTVFMYGSLAAVDGSNPTPYKF